MSELESFNKSVDLRQIFSPVESCSAAAADWRVGQSEGLRAGASWVSCCGLAAAGRRRASSRRASSTVYLHPVIQTPTARQETGSKVKRLTLHPSALCSKSTFLFMPKHWHHVTVITWPWSAVAQWLSIGPSILRTQLYGWEPGYIWWVIFAYEYVFTMITVWLNTS